MQAAILAEAQLGLALGDAARGAEAASVCTAAAVFRAAAAVPCIFGAVPLLVERFDRRGTEPFELFRSEFGQNSFKIQEFSLENLKISEIIFNNF